MNTKEFWDFFESIEGRLLIEFELKDPYASPSYEALGMALRDYSEGLSWEHFKDRKRHKNILTITTNSNKDYFLAAITLVEKAPRFIHWEFQALVPPISSYTKAFLNSNYYLDGIPIKIKDLKVTVACYNTDDTYILAFLLPFEFRTKDEDKLNSDLYVLLEKALGERRIAQTIEFFVIYYDNEFDYEYTSIDQVDKEMMEHDAWLNKKRQLEASKFKS